MAGFVDSQEESESATIARKCQKYQELSESRVGLWQHRV